MVLSDWQIWFIISIVLLTLEIFSSGFFFVCLGLSSLVVCICSLFDFSVIIQVIVFAISAILFLVYIRPIFNHLTKNKEIKTGMDALIGRHVKVIEQIDNSQDKGIVSVDGDRWQARSINDTIIKNNSFVEICHHESLVLYVKSIEN